MHNCTVSKQRNDAKIKKKPRNLSIFKGKHSQGKIYFIASSKDVTFASSELTRKGGSVYMNYEEERERIQKTSSNNATI